MEAQQIDVTSVPQEDAAKITWLWDRLDELVQANVNLAAENELLQGQVVQRDAMLDNARAGQKRHGEEIIAMGRELNAARSAAASAVEDYIANTER